MARPKDSDSAATYDAILRAAQRVVADHGLGAMSFRRVAKEADLAIGTVTYYFADRAELIEACLTDYYDALERLALPFVARLAQGGEPAHAIVEEGVAAIARHAFDHRGAVRLRLLANAEGGELSPTHRKRFATPLLAKVSPFLAKLTRDPIEARLCIQSVNYAVTRYAAMTDAELTEATGCDDAVQARERAITHVVRLALRVL